ncbi:MAG: hypothetical protein K9G33_11830 [Sneathiella sp.]|nr:hypothetical protein [Sneathiella sp.]
MVFFLVVLDMVVIGSLWLMVRSDRADHPGSSGGSNTILNLLFLVAMIINIVLFLWFVGVSVFAPN